MQQVYKYKKNKEEKARHRAKDSDPLINLEEQNAPQSSAISSQTVLTTSWRVQTADTHSAQEAFDEESFFNYQLLDLCEKIKNPELAVAAYQELSRIYRLQRETASLAIYTKNRLDELNNINTPSSRKDPERNVYISTTNAINSFKKHYKALYDNIGESEKRKMEDEVVYILHRNVDDGREVLLRFNSQFKHEGEWIVEKIISESLAYERERDALERCQDAEYIIKLKAGFPPAQITISPPKFKLTFDYYHKTLYHEITESSLPLEKNIVFRIIRDLVLGICSLKEAKIVHNDIHPANILLLQENGMLRARISDFSHAYIMEKENKKTSQEAEPDYKDDVYSVGRNSCAMVLKKVILTDEDLELNEDGVLKSIPEKYLSFNFLIWKCLSKDKSDRPNINELKKEICPDDAEFRNRMT